jgi:hypothetical protein
MDTPETAAAPAETSIAKPEKSDGSIAFTVFMMLLAVACVAITGAIAFYDMGVGR